MLFIKFWKQNDDDFENIGTNNFCQSFHPFFPQFENQFYFACRFPFVRIREFSSFIFFLCWLPSTFFACSGLIISSKTFLQAFGNVTKSEP